MTSIANLGNLFGLIKDPHDEVVTLPKSNLDEPDNNSNISLIHAVRSNTEDIVKKIDRDLEASELVKKRLLREKRLHMAMYDALVKVETEID